MNLEILRETIEEGADKQRYSDFCDKENIPIFSQPWWLDAICESENWDCYLIGNGNDIKASFVYYIRTVVKNDKTEKSIERALLTQNNGIYIKYPSGQGIISKQKYEEKIVNEICDYIENMGLIRYDQQYSRKFDNFLPFFWRYYQSTIKYTYLIENTAKTDEVRQGYSSKVKNELRKAQRYLCIREVTDLEEFYRINELSFTRQQMDIPYSYAVFCRLYEACKEHDSCKLLGAYDDNGVCHSVAMLVWDKESVYYLLNGTNPEYKAYQGNYLLIDYGIELAGKMGRSFDFEGSVIKSVNYAYREFGGKPVPYFRISKEFGIK